MANKAPHRQLPNAGLPKEHLHRGGGTSLPYTVELWPRTKDTREIKMLHFWLS